MIIPLLMGERLTKINGWCIFSKIPEVVALQTTFKIRNHRADLEDLEFRIVFIYELFSFFFFIFKSLLYCNSIFEGSLRISCKNEKYSIEMFNGVFLCSR